MKTALINRYRPQTFAEVFGNETSVRALEETLRSPSCPHTFLFTGPSGVGKTTLARIVALSVNSSIEELDAASNSGIDNMRQLVETAKFQPITETNSKMIILDECHALSKPAFQSILKLIEEPPSYLYIALCTTELSKIPDNIQTRCYKVRLQPLKINEISDFIATIAELEGWIISDAVFQGIIQASTGQPRKALTILQAGHSATTLEELSLVVAEVEKESSSLTELCRFLLQGGKDWVKISTLLSKIEDEDDNIAQACRYLTNVMINGNEEIAKKAWKILDALTFPRASWDKKTQLVASIGSLFWAQ